MTEMPSVMARICGICPVSHLMASAKACDELLAVEIPPTAVKLRKVMNLAQFVQSHALSLFPPVLARTCCWASTPTRPSATSSA